MVKQSTFGKKAEEKVLESLMDLPEIDGVSRPPRGEDGLQIDAIATCKDLKFIVEIKATSKSGSAEIEGRLASAILTGEKHLSGDRKLLPMVFAPRIGPRVLSAMKAFMEEYRPQLAWGAIDEEGVRYLEIPQASLEVHGEARETFETKRRDTNTTKKTFTDVNRLILKQLLYERSPEKFQENLHRGESKNPADLARKLSHVSKPKVYQAVNTFKERNLLNWDRSGFFFPNVRELLQRWLAVEREEMTDRFAVRSMFGESFDVVVAKATQRGLGYGISGFAACEFYNKLHTDYSVPEIYIFDPLEDFVDEAELEVVDDHAADLYLRKTNYQRSITEELRSDDGRRRYVDLLQAALDVSHDPRRGLEQAEFIANEVVRWVDHE
jgi:hypothetical protein